MIFAPDEWYHIYTRGVDKRPIFLADRDAERFLMLLYAANSAIPIQISNLGGHKGPTLEVVLQQKRGTQLVDIGAYCLMKNHPHLVLREKVYGGISAFMQKLGTGYTMYFNKKYQRTGALFSSRFKARHVMSDQYFRRLINYIHANPAELFERDWKKGRVKNERQLKHKLLSYRFSSLPDYEKMGRPEAAIINITAVSASIQEYPSLASLLEDARVFNRQEETLEE